MNRTWTPYVDGDDIVIEGIASWFGGANDPDDDGETASGLSTKANPEILGCALPIPTCQATKGSPLPVLPYKTTMVQVEANNNQITIPLIDVGPALDEDRPIDLTVATFKALGGDPKTGLMPCKLRVLGGANFVRASNMPILA